MAKRHKSLTCLTIQHIKHAPYNCDFQVASRPRHASADKHNERVNVIYQDLVDLRQRVGELLELNGKTLAKPLIH